MFELALLRCLRVACAEQRGVAARSHKCIMYSDYSFPIAAPESYTKCMFFHLKLSEGLNVLVQGFSVESLMHGEIGDNLID
jgi:hypothetical protein